MFRRLFLAYLALLVLALGVLALLAGGATRRRVMDEIEARLAAETQMLRPVARAAAGSGTLQATLLDLGRALGTRLTVIGADGAVLADSGADPATMDNHNGRPEVAAARARGTGLNLRHSDTLEADLMYYAARLDPSRPEGPVVRAALPLDRVHEEVAAVYRAILAAFALVGLAAAGAAYALARWLTRPLRQMRSVADCIAGGDFSCRISPLPPGEFGSVAAALNRMADELASRMEALRTEGDKLAAVVAGMEEGVLALDGKGRVVHANAAARELFGTRVDPGGLRVWEVVRLHGLEEKVRRVLASGVTERAEWEIGPRVVAVGMSSLPARGGALVVARDVTETHRYDVLRKEFVANVSHELRTPLSLIQGYLETLTAGAWRDAQRAPEFLGTIDSHVRRLGALVEDLLELSRLDAAGPILKPRRIDVRPLLDKVRETFAPLAARKRQTLAVAAGPDPRAVEADPDMLERALGNLVDNAIKYTPESGRIQLRLRAEPDVLLIEVEDNGIGIPPAELPRVFERFYRVDKSRSRELGGTGLGLSIVKHIAQAHGGSVEAESRIGLGSTFRIRIPASPLR